MQIDANARRRLVNRRVIVGDVEAEAVRVSDAAVAEALQERVDSLEIFAPDQQVEITARPERRMGVQRFGQ